MGQCHHFQPAHEVLAFTNEIIIFKITLLDHGNDLIGIGVDHQWRQVGVQSKLEYPKEGSQFSLDGDSLGAGIERIQVSTSLHGF